MVADYSRKWLLQVKLNVLHDSGDTPYVVGLERYVLTHEYVSATAAECPSM